jgi:hypothetical protein
MLARRARRRVAGLGQHSAGLQRAHSGLPQCGVVQQLWVDSIIRQVAIVRLQHNASAMDHSSDTAIMRLQHSASAMNHSSGTTIARCHTADRAQ